MEQLSGHYSQAIADLTWAISLQPQNPKLYILRGEAYSYKGEFDEAMADLAMALQLNPREAWAHNVRGRAWIKRGDRESAITEFGEAIRLDEKCPHFYSERGRLYLAKHELGRALDDFDLAIQLQPRFFKSVIFDLHKVRSQTGEWPGDSPEAKVLWHAGGEVKVPGLSDRNRDILDRAIDDFDFARRSDPRMSWVITLREGDAARIRKDDRPRFGLSLVREKRSEQGAEPTYSILAVQFDTRVQPYLAPTFIARGRAYMEKGDRAAALADFRDAIEAAVDSDSREEARRLCRELDPE